jgi:hypothetical protein
LRKVAEFAILSVMVDSSLFRQSSLVESSASSQTHGSQSLRSLTPELAFSSSARRPPMKQARMESNIDMIQMMDRFGTEEKCRAVLEELRWPDGIRCPRCNSVKISLYMTERSSIATSAATSSQ